jgi:hypothetical protein
MGWHAKLSASAAERWMTCPGSVALTAQHGGTSSEPAAEGTFAHHIAAVCLAENRDPAEWLGNKTVIDGFTIECNQEMVDGVNLYLATVREDRHPGDVEQIELSLTPALVTLHPDLGGTADFVRYRPSTKSLCVTDFKYGAGVLVDVVDNKQLKVYALGVLLSMTALVKDITLRIVQPRIDTEEGTVRDYHFTALEVLDFVAQVEEAAIATQHPDAPLVASTAACKWCPARVTCPELEKQQHALVTAEFTATKLYDPAKLAAALDAIPMVESRIKALREFAYIAAERGNPPPGYKLVNKLARRKWVSAATVGEILEQEPGDWYEPRTLKSPAQVETAMGKKKFKELLSEHAAAVSSGRTLVHDSDKRAPVGPGVTAESFAVIEGTATRVEATPFSILDL